MHFVLVPDAITANFVRERLAEKALSNVKVGNFQALLDALQELWLIPPNERNFRVQIEHAALKMPNAFWSKSIQVDEPSVVRLLENTAAYMLEFSALNGLPNNIDVLQTRQEGYFNDMVQLLEKADALPQHLYVATEWLKLVYEQSLSPLNLYYDPALFCFKPWQKAVVECLELHKSEDNVVSSLIQEVFEGLKQKGSDEYVSIGERLFTGAAPDIQPKTMKGILCRDVLDESQVLVNRIQMLLKEGVPASQIAVMYPGGSAILTWLNQVSHEAGIPISNLPSEDVIHDWQKQLLRDLIRLQIANPPPMAYRSVLANPLMPWFFSPKLNRILDLNHRSSEWADEVADGLFALVFEKITEADALQKWITQIGTYLQAIPAYNLGQQRWQELLDQLATWLDLFNDGSFEQICKNLLAQLQSTVVRVSAEKPFYMNSVLAVSSQEYLPKTVEHLFVVGFNEGYYRFDLQQPLEGTLLEVPLCDDLGWMAHLSEELEHKRAILKSNLAKVTGSLTLMASNQGLDGSVLELSESALDMGLCFQQSDELDPYMLFKKPQELEEGLLSWKTLTTATESKSGVEDLLFERNLLELHRGEDGKLRSESPSSLEKLMVSPLDWLLNRQGLEDQTWKVETLDNIIQGQVAHKVFELYKGCQTVTLTDALFERLFEQALALEAPFVLQPAWRLERTHLKQDVRKALDAMVPWLNQAGWKIDEVEIRLEGELWNIPVKGFSDAILSKHDEVMILDYKKSKSDKRVKRLEAGFDLQTFIYRELYQQKFGQGKVKSGYYTLNDLTLVLDQHDASSGSDIKIKVPENVSLQEQSAMATQLIEQRLRELSDGKIMLNRSEDQTVWAKVGIEIYALKDNHVVKRFVIEEQI
jgi:hypothetical protein